MKGNKKYTVTREVYKAVKRYDRQQFDSFCLSIYTSGYEDGQKSVPGIELPEVLSLIGTVKGIGPKKLEEISKALGEKFDDRGNSEGV